MTPTNYLRCLPALLALAACLAAQAQRASHYELHIQPDFEAQQLQVQARLRIEGLDAAGGTLLIAAPALQIKTARLAGQDLALRQDAAGWRVELPAHRAGSIELELGYRAMAAAGLVFGRDYVYTAYESCNWLPCVGQLLDRATLQAHFELPPGFRSVASSGSRPYALYTLGFAAGRFSEALASAGTMQLRYLGAADDAAGLLARFASTPAMLAFFEAKAGAPLPQPVYTQLLVPGGEAQEVSQHAVIGKAMLDPILDTPEEDWVIAHELAHQWWGNLITCADWNEFWLNEGITTFMTAAWKQQRWGEAAYQRELDLASKRWERAKAAGFDKPLSWPGDYPSLGIKRAIHYSKGALFMHALRQELGEALFWAGFKRYTQANLGRGVKAADLQLAMEGAAGRSLQALFERWVY